MTQFILIRSYLSVTFTSEVSSPYSLSRIAELTAELEKADGNRGENNSELNDTVAELNQTNKELRDEINAIRMENA